MTNVLIFSHSLIPSVRLCGYEQCRFLAEEGKIQTKFATPQEITPKLGGWPDVIFMVRSDSKAELFCAKAWKKAGKTLLYVLDDDLPNIPEGFSSSAYYRNPSVRKYMEQIMAVCDGFLSPSAHLREKYGKKFPAVYAVEEPALFHAPFVPKAEDDPVRIGFAGSVDRATDLETLLGSTVKRLLQTYPNRISVEFFGAAPAFAKELGLRQIPYTENYQDYQKTMETLAWDIGLAPMPDTEFHRGKHYNKFIEYAGAGIVGVYSNLPPYCGVIQNGVDGVLCENHPNAFFQSISELIENPDRLRTLRENVIRKAERDFSVSSCAHLLKAELGTVLTGETNRSSIVNLWVVPIINLAERVKNGVRERGFFGWIFYAAGKIFKKFLSR